MPKCRSCGQPIIFLRPEPTQYQPEPKPLPVNVAPDRSGTLAIYQRPSPFSAYPADRDFAGIRQSYFRRLSGPALESYVRHGGSVYRVHFDTCPARR